MRRHSRTTTRSRRPARAGHAHWARVALIAVVALTVIGDREGLLPVPGAGWLSAPAERPPIRAAINIGSQRTDCSVARVIDGDTVDLDCPGAGAVRARLLGFDTPEVFSPGCVSELALGRRATSALHAKIRSAGRVTMVFEGLDKYDRRLTRLYLDGDDVARAMVAEGLARAYHGGRRAGWCA